MKAENRQLPKWAVVVLEMKKAVEDQSRKSPSRPQR